MSRMRKCCRDSGGATCTDTGVTDAQRFTLARHGLEPLAHYRDAIICRDSGTHTIVYANGDTDMYVGSLPVVVAEIDAALDR